VPSSWILLEMSFKVLIPLQAVMSTECARPWYYPSTCTVTSICGWACLYGARSVVIDQSQKELHISRCRQRGQHSQDSLLIHPIHNQTQGNDELDMFAWKKAISLFSHHRYSELITNEQKTQLRALVLAIYSKAYNNASPPQFQTFLNHLCDFPKTLGFQQNNLNLVQSSIVSAS
jgi:hypothetical protein